MGLAPRGENQNWRWQLKGGPAVRWRRRAPKPRLVCVVGVMGRSQQGLSKMKSLRA